jgi:hypothetical protein
LPDSQTNRGKKFWVLKHLGFDGKSETPRGLKKGKVCTPDAYQDQEESK